MSELILDISEKTIAHVEDELDSFEDNLTFIDYVRGFMGPKLATGMRKFRQTFFPALTPFKFDTGGSFLFLPVYRQLEQETFKVNWSEIDFQQFAQGARSRIDGGKFLEELQSFGPAMRVYILDTIKDKAQFEDTPQDSVAFKSGISYMAYLTAEAIQMQKTK